MKSKCKERDKSNKKNIYGGQKELKKKNLFYLEMCGIVGR